jgi:hypothetical protein
MKVLRNILNIPLRIVKLLAIVAMVLLDGALIPWFGFVIDPLIWILTGKYTCFDDRINKVTEHTNRIVDKLDFDTRNR